MDQRHALHLSPAGLRGAGTALVAVAWIIIGGGNVQAKTPPCAGGLFRWLLARRPT